MADNLRKFTTQEVLNKVYTDSSGITIGLNSQSSKETLNAVLDSSNNRLQVAMAGGTISGDVTISGDLTVSGDNVLNVSETIQGKLNVVEGAGTLPSGIGTTTGDLIIAQNNDTTTDIAAIYAIAGNAGSSHFVFGDADSKNPGRVSYDHSDNSMDLVTNSTVRMTITSAGNVTIPANAELQEAAQGDAGNRIKLKNSSNGNMEFKLENSAYNYVFPDGKFGIGTTSIPSTHTDIAHLSIGADASIIGTKASGTSSNSTFAHNAYFDSSDSRWEYIGSSSNEASALQLLDGKIVAKVAAAGTANNAITWIDAMTITSAGLVGIGTSSPSTLVEIQGGLTTTGAVLTLSTKEPSVVANDVLGRINFQAPLETGADAISVSASIHALATGGFQAWDNPTDLVFSTGASEVATEKMRITSTGNITTTGNFIISGANKNINIIGNFPTINLKANNEQQLNFMDAGGGTESGIKNNTGTMKFYGSSSSSAFRMILDSNSRISLSNNDNNTGNTVFGKSAWNTTSNVGADYNVAIGELAMGTGTLSNATYNVAVGYSALTDVTTGDYNVVIGGAAASNLVGGSDNVAIGTNALFDAVSITKTISIGTQALENINDDANDGSVGIGYLAGSKKVGTGSQYTKASVHIGYSSGAAQTTGANNTSVGHATMGGDVLGTALTGSDNTVMGHKAGYAMQGASSSNTIVGSDSGLALTTSSNNVAIGHDSFKAVVDACNSNVSIGVQSMMSVDRGSHADAAVNGNIAIGYNALAGGDFVDQDKDLTGNIAIGKNALDATAANQSIGQIAIGEEALTALTSGTQNTCIGYKAGAELSDNNANTAIGYQAMFQSGTTTYHNTFVGATSGSGDWSGACHSNTAVGSNTLAGVMTVTAVDNVAVGRDVMYQLTQGASNTAVGKSAGGVLTTGLNNTIIGKGSNPSANNATNQTVVGYAVTGIADNSVVLGNSAVTKVYMASDATDGTTQTEGAEILAKSGYFKSVGLDADSGGTDKHLLTLHGAYDADVTGGQGHGIRWIMQDEATNNAETARISSVSVSGNMNSNLSGFGSKIEFHNMNQGSLVKQMTIQGNDDRQKVEIHGNNKGSGGGEALKVENDGNNANREGIHIHAGVDSASSAGDNIYLQFKSGDGDAQGGVRCSSTVANPEFFNGSDIRMKKDIKETSIKGLDIIESIPLKEWNWNYTVPELTKEQKEKGEKKKAIKKLPKQKIGIVADDLEKVLPHLVSTNTPLSGWEHIVKEGDDPLKTIPSETELTLVLMKAVQELSAKVKEFESK